MAPPLPSKSDVFLVQNQETCEAMEVQGAKPPAGARGVPALSLFPKRLADDALGTQVH